MNDQNLIPAKPGEVRNPNGRPKGSQNFKTILKRILNAKTGQYDADGNELTQYDILALNLMQKAQEGDVPAVRELLDRYEGKVAQGIDVTSRTSVIDDRLKELPEAQLNKLLSAPNDSPGND